MRKSPTTLPNRPSIGIAFIHRKWPGKSASRAGTKISSQNPPRTLAIGEPILRERNQRTPSVAENTGSKNAPIPKPCKTRSEIRAPTTPIQLRAARDPVSTEALFNEGSNGEYEANARKRRSAETNKRKPTSSLSRRLLVGAKICLRYLIGVFVLRRSDTRARSARSVPEPFDYDKNERTLQLRILGSIQNDKHHLCHQ